MSEAAYLRKGETIAFTAAVAYTAGEVLFLAGLLCVAVTDFAIGALAVFQITGIHQVTASGTEPAGPKGAPVFWDSSANKATLYPVSASGDCLIGTLAEASAANATAFDVLINVYPQDLPAALFAGKTLETKADDYTVDAQDTGKIIAMTVTAKTFTLPSTAAGLELIVMSSLTSGGTLNVSPNANDKIMGPDVAGVDNKDYILSAAAEVGDYLHLVADGASGWYVKAQRGTWTQEA